MKVHCHFQVQTKSIYLIHDNGFLTFIFRNVAINACQIEMESNNTSDRNIYLSYVDSMRKKNHPQTTRSKTSKFTKKYEGRNSKTKMAKQSSTRPPVPQAEKIRSMSK